MTGPGYPADARGWMTLGLFIEVNVIIGALVLNPHLADMDLFKSIAQAIILQGFLQLAAAFYFTASKTGAELAASNARIAEQAATATTSGDKSSPKDATDAANQVADAAANKADQIAGANE